MLLEVLHHSNIKKYIKKVTKLENTTESNQINQILTDLLGEYKENIIDIFSLPENIKPRLIIALGKPKETVEIIDMIDDDIRYYRDGKDKNIVPKRPLDELLIN